MVTTAEAKAARELAEKATPGPWAAGSDDQGSWVECER